MTEKQSVTGWIAQRAPLRASRRSLLAKIADLVRIDAHQILQVVSTSQGSPRYSGLMPDQMTQRCPRAAVTGQARGRAWGIF